MPGPNPLQTTACLSSRSIQIPCSPFFRLSHSVLFILTFVSDVACNLPRTFTWIYSTNTAEYRLPLRRNSGSLMGQKKKGNAHAKYLENVPRYSLIGCWGIMPERTGCPKHIVRVCWKHLIKDLSKWSSTPTPRRASTSHASCSHCRGYRSKLWKQGCWC